MNEPEIKPVSPDVVATEQAKSDEHEPDWGGRCRIYDSSKTLIGCKNVSSESSCQEWAQWRGAWGYGWSPGYSC